MFFVSFFVFSDERKETAVKELSKSGSLNSVNSTSLKRNLADKTSNEASSATDRLIM